MKRNGKKMFRMSSVFILVVLILQSLNLNVFSEYVAPKGLDVSVENIEFTKFENSAIAGSVKLTNNTDTVMEALACKFDLSIEIEGRKYPVLRISKNVSLAKYESLILPFEDMGNFALSAGNYQMIVFVRTNAGEDLGVNSKSFDNKGSGDKIVVYDSLKSYFLNKTMSANALAGPTCAQGETPTLRATFKNLSAQPINAKAKIKVYRRSIERNPIPVIEKDFEGNYSFDATQTKDVDFVLPGITEPDSYFVNIFLYDETGKIVSSIIEARYVVAGVCGKIINPVVTVENGRLNLSESITGPADMSSVDNVVFTLTIREGNTTIYSDSKYVRLALGVLPINMSIPFSKTGGEIEVESKIEYEGKQLDKVIVKYSLPELVAEVTPNQTGTAAMFPTPTIAPEKLNRKIALDNVLVTYKDRRLKIMDTVLGPVLPAILSGVSVRTIVTDNTGYLLFDETNVKSLLSGVGSFAFETPYIPTSGKVYVRTIVSDNGQQVDNKIYAYYSDLLGRAPVVTLTQNGNAYYCSTQESGADNYPSDTGYAQNQNLKFDGTVISYVDGKFNIYSTITSVNELASFDGIKTSAKLLDAAGNELLNDKNTISINSSSECSNFSVPIAELSGMVTLDMKLENPTTVKDSFKVELDSSKLVNNCAVVFSGIDKVYYGQYNLKPWVEETSSPYIQETSSEMANGSLEIVEKISAVPTSSSSSVTVGVEVKDEAGNIVLSSSKTGDVSIGALYLTFSKECALQSGKITVKSTVSGDKVFDTRSYTFDVLSMFGGRALDINGTNGVVYDNSVVQQGDVCHIGSVYANYRNEKFIQNENILGAATATGNQDVAVVAEALDANNKILSKRMLFGSIAGGTMNAGFGFKGIPSGVLKVNSYLINTGKVVDSMTCEYSVDRMTSSFAVIKDGSYTVDYSKKTADIPKNFAESFKFGDVKAYEKDDNLVLSEKIASSIVSKMGKLLNIATVVKDSAGNKLYESEQNIVSKDVLPTIDFFIPLYKLSSSFIVTSTMKFPKNELDTISFELDSTKLKNSLGMYNRAKNEVVYEIQENKPIVPLIKIKDIAGTPYEECVQTLVDNGIIKGYPDETFKPLNSITRAEFMALAFNLIKRIKMVEDSNKQASFKDVLKTHWANKIIAQGEGIGLLKGYPDNTFRPNDKINYAEGITVCVKLIGSKEESSILKVWPNDFVKFADSKGILAGFSKKDCQIANRGDMARLIYNVFMKIKNK